LYNPNSTNIDISGWYVLDSDTVYIIPQGTIINADGYFIVASELVKFNNKHPSVPLDRVAGGSFMAFSGNGEQVALLNNNKCMVDEFNYNEQQHHLI